MSAIHRPPAECLRCRGRMEVGFTLDEGYGVYHVARWIAGEPVRSFWMGLKIRGRDKLAVTTYRCRSCGLLEHYAGD